jgi:NDP-sugar pyrophosphorylase family protein
MKNKIDAIIPCAGNSKRMQTSLPKALLKVNGESSLNNQLKLLNKYIDNFYIIINENFNEKDKYIKRIDKQFLRKITFISSKAGSGDGMAILDGLNYINISKNIQTNIFVCWGDVYFKNENIIKLFKDYFFSKKILKTMLIPLKFKKNPYVAFLFDRNSNVKKVLFQRRNQFVDFGYQDLGIFLINKNFTQKILTIMKKKTDKNIELNFLDSIERLYNNKKYIKPYILKIDPETYSFNKINELNIIRYHAKK